MVKMFRRGHRVEGTEYWTVDVGAFVICRESLGIMCRSFSA